MLGSKLSSFALVCVAISGSRSTDIPIFHASADVAQLSKALSVSVAGNAATLHAQISGLSALGHRLPGNVCSSVAKIGNQLQSVADVYHMSEAITIGGCELPVHLIETSAKLVEPVLNSRNARPRDIYHAAAAARTIGIDIESPSALLERLATLLDPTGAELADIGYACAAVVALGLDKLAFIRFSGLIEKLGSAGIDAKNVKHLSQLFLGISALAADLQVPLPFSSDQLTSISTRLVAASYGDDPIRAASIAKALHVLSDNRAFVPVVTRVETDQIPVNNTTLRISIVSVLMTSLPVREVVVKSINGLDNTDGSKLTAINQERTSFSLDLSSFGLSRGFYSLGLKIEMTEDDSRFIGLKPLIELKFQTTVIISDASLCLKEKKETVNFYDLVHPATLPVPVRANEHNRVMVAFKLKEGETGAVASAHQVFLRFTNELTNQEVIFVVPETETEDIGTTDSINGTGEYLIDIDIQASASRVFASTSGMYSVDLVVGDLTFANRIEWRIAVMELDLGAGVMEDDSISSTSETLTKVKEASEKGEYPSKISTIIFAVLALIPALLLPKLLHTLPEAQFDRKAE